MFSGVSPREDPNEGTHPRVRESVEPVLSGLIDAVFGLVFVLLRELLLEARQRISIRLFQYVLAARTHDYCLSLVPSISVRAVRDRNVNDPEGHPYILSQARRQAPHGALVLRAPAQ